MPPGLLTPWPSSLSRPSSGNRKDLFAGLVADPRLQCLIDVLVGVLAVVVVVVVRLLVDVVEGGLSTTMENEGDLCPYMMLELVVGRFFGCLEEERFSKILW